MANSWVEGPEPNYVKSYGSEPDQIVEFYDGSGPVVAVIHGGYWRAKHTREHMRALSSKLAKAGFLVANIEYRREPLKPVNTLSDVKSALETLSNPTAIIGFSVGGQLALMNSNYVHKLVLLAPVTDLERTKREKLGEDAVDEFFGEISLTDFDPMQRDYDSHLYLIHGDNDDRVPVFHSRDFVKAKGGALTEISGADHFDVINPDGLVFELILKALA